MPVCEGTQIYIHTHVSYPNTSQRWGTPARELVTLPAPLAGASTSPHSHRGNSSNAGDR